MTKGTVLRRLISLALILVMLCTLMPVLAETARYGKVSDNKVRFRKSPTTAPEGEWWTMLDKGWVVMILENLTANKAYWFHVRTTIPEDPGKVYDGYIMAEYLKEMKADEISGFLANPVQPDGSAAYTGGSGDIVTPVPVTPVPVTDAPTTAVPPDSITPVPAESPLGYIILVKDGVNLRETPNGETLTPEESQWLPIGLILPYYALPVEKGGFNWIQVKYNGQIGYIRSDCYSLSSEGPTPVVPITAVPVTDAPVTGAPVTDAPPTDGTTPVPGTALGYIILVKDGVNLREKPNGETLTPEESQWLPVGLILPYYAEPVEKAGFNWILVKYNDQFGYIRSDCYSLNLTPSTTLAPTTPETDPSIIGQWGHTTKDKVFFRMAPGYTADVWELLPLGWNLKIIGSTTYGYEIWINVEGGTPSEPDKNHVGYINAQFFATGLSSVTPTPVSTPVPTATATAVPTSAPVADGDYGFVKVEGTILRESASSTAAAITALPYGQLAQILDHPAGFYHVKTDGKVGYIAESALKTLTAEEYYSLISATETPAVTPTLTPGTTPVATSTSVPVTPTPDAGSTPLGYIILVKDGVNLREKPNGGTLTPEESQWLPIGQILPYYAEPVEKAGFEWILVWYKDQFGYIRSDCYAITQDPGTTPAPTAVPTLIGYVKLNKGGVNVRKEPNGEVVGKLNLGTVLGYYGTKTVDNVLWYYVYSTTLGRFGYVMGSLCDYTTAPTTPPSGETTEPPVVTVSPQPGEYGYVCTTANKVYLRESTSTGSKALDQIPTQNTVMRMTGISVVSGGITWYPVTYGGTNGFVHGSFSRLLTAAEVEEYKKSGLLPTPTPEPTAVPVITVTPVTPVTDAPTATPASGGYIITTADKLFVRKEPSTAANYLGQIAYSGTVLQMNGSPVVSGGITWYPVLYNGQSGYVHGNFSRQLTPAEVEEYEKSGKLPTPTPAPTATQVPDVTATPTAAPTLIQYLMVTTDKVFVRTGAGTNYSPIADNFFVNKDEAYPYDSIVINNGITWYHIQYDASTVGYVHGNFVKLITEAEYEAWKKGQAPTPTPVPTALPTTTPGQEELLLTLGSTGEKVLQAQKRLVTKGYLTADDATGVYGQNTMNAVVAFQTSAGLPVNGNINQATWDKLFGEGGSSEGTPYYVDGSSVSVVLNPVEMIDWYTGDIQTLWAVGTTAIITDVYTGISFRARRWSGGNHADVEPLTSADTDSILKIYGVTTAQAISDRQQELQSWRRRPAWVTINGRTVAGSLYLVPHNYPDGDTIPDNNFNGQFCVHFVNSKTHGNATNPATVDYDRELNGYFGHQSAIKYAYDHSISGKK